MGLPALRPSLTPREDPSAREEIPEDAAEDAPETQEEAQEEGADDSAPASARERTSQHRERRRATQLADASHQSDHSAVEDWRTLDVQKALETLKSDDAGVRRKALQRLHIRWWHVPSEAFQRTLRVAAAPARAVAEVPSVVQACSICRDWRRPGPRDVATFRLVLEFNEEVQFDLMFYTSLLEPARGSIPVAHLIDSCIRFSQTGTTRRDEIALCTIIARTWIAIFGPMTTLTLDEETGMRGQCVTDWASAMGVHLKFKAPRQKAWIVERHNEILRVSLHSTESQLLKEEIRCTFDIVLALVTFMKNAMVVINGATPYQSLLGRQPAMLPPLEGGHLGQVDSHARPETGARFHARIREIGTISVVQAAARDRAARADRSQTRGHINLQDFKPGDSVDIWFDPTAKDVKGWRGPAELKSINESEGNVSVRFQGRTLDRRNAEVRPHVAFLVYASMYLPELFSVWLYLKQYCQGLKSGTCVIVGIVLSSSGWLLIRFGGTEEGKQLLQSGLELAHRLYHIPNCTTIRFWKGCHSVPALLGGFVCSEVVAWAPDDRVDIDAPEPECFTPEPGDLERSLPAKSLAVTVASQDPDVGWKDVCFIQFLGMNPEDAKAVRDTFPDVPMLGGTCFDLYPPASAQPKPPSGSRDGGGSGPPPLPPPPPPTSTLIPYQPIIPYVGPMAIGPHLTPHVHMLPPPPLPGDVSMSQSSMSWRSCMSSPYATPMSTPGGGGGGWGPPPPPPGGGSQLMLPPWLVGPWGRQDPAPSLIPPSVWAPGTQAWFPGADTFSGGTPTPMSVISDPGGRGYLDADDVVMGLRRALRQCLTPESVHSRSPYGATPAAHGDQEQEQLPDNATPASTVRSRTPRRLGGRPGPDTPPPLPPPNNTPPHSSPHTPSSVAPSSVPVPTSPSDSRISTPSIGSSPHPVTGKRSARTPPDAPLRKKDRRAEDKSDHQNTGATASTDPAPPPQERTVQDPQEDDESSDGAEGLVLEESTFWESWNAELEEEVRGGLDSAFEVIFRKADIQRQQCEPIDLSSVRAFIAEQGELLVDHSSRVPCGLSVATGLQFGLEGCLAKCHTVGETLLEGDVLVYTVSGESEGNAIIVRDVGTLSKEELTKNAKEVALSKYKEIKGLFDLNCFKRMPRKLAKNILDTRWVITWKIVEGVRVIKCRITLRGFKDREQSYETFAGTASRAGQRVINSLAAQEEDMELFSLDVSQAFAKGLSFEELARAFGEPLREVEVDFNKGDVELLRTIPGWENFNPELETIKLLKPIYGLKDAPRAWRKRLHQVLTSWGASQLLAEPELYALHDVKSMKTQGNPIEQRREAEQRAVAESPMPVQEWLTDRKAKILCVLSAHVDDLKGAATRKVALSLLKHLEEHFGKCKLDWADFMHTGIRHIHKPGRLECHQYEYIEALRPMAIPGLKGVSPDKEVGNDLHGLYMSLLGGCAWCVLTRADAAVYIQALQRRAHQPRYVDCRRLNVVVRYMQRTKVSIVYEKIAEPIRILGFSDSAFKAQEEESTGLALRSLVVCLVPESSKLAHNGKCHLLDFVVRRLKRVVRSTFSAELNALIDGIETMLLTQLILHQIYCGCQETPEQLIHRLEHGGLYPPIDVCLDANAVFDAIAAKDTATPLEASLKLHILSIKAKVLAGTLRTVGWLDTREMVADGLNKGSVSRSQLLSVSKGQLSLGLGTRTLRRGGGVLEEPGSMA